MQSTHSLLAMANLLKNRTELQNRLTQVVAHLRQHRLSSSPAPYGDSRLPIRAQLRVLDSHSQLGKTQWIQINRLDRHGITFTHPQPLCDRRVLISYENSTVGPFAAEINLSWCQFNRRGEYQSGGRFVQLANLSA